MMMKICNVDFTFKHNECGFILRTEMGDSIEVNANIENEYIIIDIDNTHHLFGELNTNIKDDAFYHINFIFESFSVGINNCRVKMVTDTNFIRFITPYEKYPFDSIRQAINILILTELINHGNFKLGISFEEIERRVDSNE